MRQYKQAGCRVGMDYLRDGYFCNKSLSSSNKYGIQSKRVKNPGHDSASSQNTHNFNSENCSYI